MGLFSKLFNKNSEKTFENVSEEVLMISNQNGRIENPTKDDLKKYLDLLFEEKGDQFITLSLETAKNSVRFMQATYIGNDLIVQLGLENNNKIKLVEKKFNSSKECIIAFYQFLDYGFVDDVELYEPVKF